jgi:hypothetical protein
MLKWRSCPGSSKGISFLRTTSEHRLAGMLPGLAGDGFLCAAQNEKPPVRSLAPEAVRKPISGGSRLAVKQTVETRNSSRSGKELHSFVAAAAGQGLFVSNARVSESAFRNLRWGQINGPRRRRGDNKKRETARGNTQFDRRQIVALEEISDTLLRIHAQIGKLTKAVRANS